MQKFLLLAFLAIVTQSLRAQMLPNQALKLNIGRAKLGTGDIQGLMLGVEYEKFFQRKLSWSAELGMTIHDGSDLLLVTEATGKVHDLSYRYTTAGAQLAGKIGYHFLRTEKWNFGVRIGGLFRYQSSSVPDDMTTLFPIATGLTIPVFIGEHTSSQKTYSVGAVSQLFAGYTIRQKIILGITTGLQLDTNGDTMFPQLLLTVGRRF